MSCDRCHDIHTAQLSGKTSDACKCSCHTDFSKSVSKPKPWLINNQPLVNPWQEYNKQITCKTDACLFWEK